MLKGLWKNVRKLCYLTDKILHRDRSCSSWSKARKQRGTERHRHLDVVGKRNKDNCRGGKFIWRIYDARGFRPYGTSNLLRMTAAVASHLLAPTNHCTTFHGILFLLSWLRPAGSRSRGMQAPHSLLDSTSIDPLRA